ncbi:MAG: YjgP/YjgQ family permease [Leptolyngbyaceae cyanobacterium RU_5_1]|nr:YjgP/YjgQ family permease [Leptolyngbyaceae cyanobacterium RU_5_1]
MDRYIATELFLPFLFGVAAFSSIGVSIGVLSDLLRKITETGLPFSIVLQVLLLKTPYYIGLSFPMSMLLSCLITYGQLSSNSELIALRGCGVSIYRLVVPAIAIGLLITGITFLFNETIVPATNTQASELLDRALNKKQLSYQQRDIIFQEYRREKQPDGTRPERLSRIFYAREFDGQNMQGLTVLDFSQTGLNQIVSSKSAAWNPEQKIWDFFNGTIYVVAPDGSYRNILKFDQQQLQLPRTPLDIAQTIRDPAEMNIAETRQHLELIKQTGRVKKIRELEFSIEQKSSLPFACLVFGLVGTTLGIRPRRTSRAAGFAICIVIIFSYYMLIVVGQALHRIDVLPAVAAGWLPTSMGAIAGIVLLMRLNR